MEFDGLEVVEVGRGLFSKGKRPVRMLDCWLRWHLLESRLLLRN